MHQHGSKYLAHRHPPSTLGEGSKGQNSPFLKHGHVAYQIKETMSATMNIFRFFFIFFLNHF